MNKWVKIAISVAASGMIAIGGYFAYMESYRPYVPLEHVEGEGLVQCPKMNTPKHQREIKEVYRTQFQAKWKIVNGKLYVQRKMYFGDYWLNYTWNMTMQADGKLKRPEVKELAPDGKTWITVKRYSKPAK